MLLWSTFFLGVVFGVFARWGRFCLLRGLRQATGLDSSEGRGNAPALQAFALALAVALLLRLFEVTGDVSLTNEDPAAHKDTPHD